MKKKFLLIILFTNFLDVALGQNSKNVFSLDDVISQAKAKSTSAKLAESIKENKYFQYLSYKAVLRPQLSLTGNVLGYSKDYFGVVQPDGNLIFQPRTQNYSSLGLSLSQQVLQTGGTISINSSLNRFDDFDRKEKRFSGAPLNISLNQPLFAFNGFKWDKKIEPLKYQEAEKEYIKETENIALSASKLYFDVLDAKIELELAKKNIEGQTTIYEVENKRINLGTTSRDKLLQIQLQLLTSKQNLGKAEVNFKMAVFYLKSFIGLNINDLELELPVSLPKITISVDKAIEGARSNRAEFLAYKRKKLEAMKELEMAKNERFKINLLASYGYNNVGDGFSSIYSNPNSQQTFNLGIQLPILDWGRNRGRISVANSNLKTISYTNEQEEVIFINEITSLVDNLMLISSNIEIAKEADEIAQERYSLASDQFKFGKLSVTDLHLALSEKDNAKRSYISALRLFWISYYQLKVLTLLDISR